MQPTSRLMLIVLCTLFSLSARAMAQGTASSPSTFHLAQGGGVGYAGGPNDLINGPNPYPIDLDVTGGPWRKSFGSDPAAGYIGTGSFTLIETVQNVGTEPWYDWHEQVFSGDLGVAWAGSASITVNGNPIAFNTTITGGMLDLDAFSQPVLPGDVMVISKDLITTSNVVAPGKPLFELLEYPTPEPGTAALMGSAGLLLLRRMRRASA